MRFFRLLAGLVAFAIFAFAVDAAFAQTVAVTAPAGSVVIPYGSWVDQVAPVIQGVVGLVIAGAVAFASSLLPSWVRSYVSANMTQQADALLAQAVDWAIAKVEGATKDQQLTIPVGNAVIASAVQFVIDHAPAALLSWLGGTASIQQKVIAQVSDILPDASKVVNGTVVPGALPAPATPTLSVVAK